ncbi:actin-related protein 8 isoform X2 [Nymphaea colorata]|uniref:actin-related protein 8 isoform X2 n=1 Tax=Nymphaea colorata TaxID=210225 RepID=UPI00129DFAA2|nr:actin-related protein 8 isoform X2 [Nymphaea colorata]
MALIFRKVWSSMVVGRSNAHDSMEPQLQSLSPLHQLPLDVILLVFKFLGPKEAARACLVCRMWRAMITDNQLWMFFLQNCRESWETILFQETILRSGYSLGSSPSSFHELPLMQIYGQRAEPSGAIIIDCGSGYCKYGWSKYPCPSARAATFMEFGNMESPTYSALRHFFSTIYASLSGRCHTQDMNRMQVKPLVRPIVVSTPICHCDARRQMLQTMYSVLFDMNVPAVCAIDQAVLALYAARCTSGVVINIGFQNTSIVPILHGRVMREIGIEVIGQGALRLTSFLAEQIRQRGIACGSMYTVRTLKENLCYVALDYEAELCKDTSASLEVPGEGLFMLSKERFQTGELLFRPRNGGMRAMGLHQAVALCMEHCVAYDKGASDDGWYKTIVLAGGTSCLPGLPERLEKELFELLPPSIAEGLKVLPPPYGAESAWFGAKIVSNVSTFREAWCINKKQFRQQFHNRFL